MSPEEELSATLATSPPWAPAITRRLATRAWRDLRSDGIGPEHYGTARVLARTPEAPRLVLAMLPATLPDLPPILVESFGAEMPERYRALGLAEGRVEPERLRSAVAGARALLDLLPDAAAAFDTLVRSLHVLKAGGPEFDTSFSDPDVPFSAFVAVHPEAVRQDGLRLAEGLLHEAMHLQLSLAEAAEPLVSGSREERHSPWQGRARPVQGLLHGLFVFRAIQRFLAMAARSGDLDAEDRAHARRRVDEIEGEVAEVSDLEGSPDLTDGGRLVATTLLRPRTGRS